MSLAATDILIVGAGIAGASLAAEVAPYARVTLIEAEDMPGRHATGRSAAFYDESYGGPGVQPLTSASGPLLRTPEPALGADSFLRPRGGIILGRTGDAAAMAAMAAAFAGTGVALESVGRAELAQRLPGLRAEWTQGFLQPQCEDIDVAALHQACLAAARRAGANILTRAGLVSARRAGDGGWQVMTSLGPVRAATLVNAAGAWADDVAVRCDAAPVGIRPFRRTMVQLRLGVETPANLPLCLDIGGQFYFKGEAVGRVWLSPHDEIPDEPRDVAPEELDVAIAIDRFEQAVDWPIAAVERRWAGLRSFAPDRLPV